MTKKQTQKKLDCFACTDENQKLRKKDNEILTFIPFFADLLIQIVV